MNKWFNKQKPITLGFITGFTCFIICYVMSYFTETIIKPITVIKFCSVISILIFFMAWSLFYTAESSWKIFDEISELYFRAKKAKTKEEIITIETDYRLLRKKCQHQNHYYKMNEVWQIIDTKKELL